MSMICPNCRSENKELSLIHIFTRLTDCLSIVLAPCKPYTS